MILESIFMIRGGVFGYEFSIKLIITIFAIFLCYYDWKTNNKRLDYFWVFLTGAIIWSLAEFLLQVVGIRQLYEKYLFGFNITNWFWLTIPLQGISEGAFVAVLSVFVGDRILRKVKKKEGLFIFLGYALFRYGIVYGLLFIMGNNFLDVNIGDPNVPSRRDIFTVPSIIYLVILITPFVYWFIRTNKKSRKRAIAMLFVMIFNVAIWTILEWLTGQRWIEVGIKTSEGTYLSLMRASPLIEFLSLAYDIIVEIVLIYMTFLAIPYLLGLIKSE